MIQMSRLSVVFYSTRTRRRSRISSLERQFLKEKLIKVLPIKSEELRIMRFQNGISKVV